MFQRLLLRLRRGLREKPEGFRITPGRKQFAQPGIIQGTALVIKIALLDGERTIPDKAHATYRAGQILLLRRGIESVAHGFLDQH